MNLFFVIKLLHTLEQLRKHEQWGRSQLESYQAEALRQMRQYTYTHSLFYQEFHKGLMDRPLQELPVLTKALMTEHFDALVTDRSLHLEDVRAYATQGEAGRRYRNRYSVNATSGSSGQPGFFVFREDEWLYVLASFARSQEWSGVYVNFTHRQRMGVVASISPWHMSSQVAASVKSWLRPSFRLPASQPLDQTIEQLNAWQPEALIAYASMIGILAGKQLAGQLNIHPKVVYASSEVLTEKIRQEARDAWGSEPFNQYAATETAGIAAEHTACRHMHVFEDLIILEVVDDAYQPVPFGEYGAKVLVTTLFSRTQPLIRYELNDSIRLRTKPDGCALPFNVLDGIQGRVENILHLPSQSGGKQAVQPLVFNRVMDIMPVTGWQIIQQADDGLVLLLAGEQDQTTNERIADQIRQSLVQEGIVLPYLQVQHVPEIPKNSAGKAPLIKAYST